MIGTYKNESAYGFGQTSLREYPKKARLQFRFLFGPYSQGTHRGLQVQSESIGAIWGATEDRQSRRYPKRKPPTDGLSGFFLGVLIVLVLASLGELVCLYYAEQFLNRPQPVHNYRLGVKPGFLD